MHGLIFASLRDYLATEHDAAVANEVLAGEPQYTLSEAYPDEQFLALLERACARTGLSHDEFLFEFGVFTAATTFARLYSVLFRSSPTARDFLLTVEDPIHEVVRVSLPDARPPELVVTELGAGRPPDRLHVATQDLRAASRPRRRHRARLRRDDRRRGGGMHASRRLGVPVRAAVLVTGICDGCPRTTDAY